MADEPNGTSLEERFAALDTAPAPKRVVLTLEDGTSQIVGVVDKQPPDILIASDGRQFSLVAARPRLYRYKQIMSPAGAVKTLDPKQQ